MKITTDDYGELKRKIYRYLNEHPEVMTKHKQLYKSKGLSDMRFRWDVFHAAKAYSGKLYNYLNDNHIDTALKSIIATYPG